MNLKLLVATAILFLLGKSNAYSQTMPTDSSSNPLVLGQVATIQSKILNEERSLNIYLPEGYNEKDTTRYPVIYLLDGGFTEDFIHVVGLVHYNSFPWINRLPKSIVVGIVNIDRKRDFTSPSNSAVDQKMAPTSGGSAAFISFLKNELQPFINTKYLTNGTNTLIGESLGGLVATEILLQQPSLFQNYIIISPSLWWKNGEMLGQSFNQLDTGIRSQTSIYIGVGKEGLTPGNRKRTMEKDAKDLAQKLKKLKRKNLYVYFDYLPEHTHADVTHQALYNAIKQLYPFKQ